MSDSGGCAARVVPRVPGYTRVAGHAHTVPTVPTAACTTLTVSRWRSGRKCGRCKLQGALCANTLSKCLAQCASHSLWRVRSMCALPHPRPATRVLRAQLHQGRQAVGVPVRHCTAVCYRERHSGHACTRPRCWYARVHATRNRSASGTRSWLSRIVSWRCQGPPCCASVLRCECPRLPLLAWVSSAWRRCARVRRRLLASRRGGQHAVA